MCGIGGLVHLDGRPAEPAIVRRMADAIAHRGPDGEGVWCRGPVGLGNRRLAIVDLSEAGGQPMASPDGDLVITYNGEVYNHRELRRELDALGWRFRSTSDTEVVLAAWWAWGEAAIPRLNGMFAFAVRDARSRQVVLVRDRYGVKPLYLATVGATVVFGSEVKALLAHPAMRAELDPEALVEYLTYQNFLSDRTLFRGVRLLPAGCLARIPFEGGGPVTVDRYWDFSFQEPEPGADRAELVEELDRLFAQAVRRQVVADVPVNAYLSGGTDTGAITAVSAREVESLRTFTIGFDLSSASGLELAFDERVAAERMSYLFGTEHYEMVLKAGDMERCLSSLMWHMEEPRVGQSYPNWYAAKLASSFGKVVLSGTGGDELFAGYPWRYYRAVVNDDFEQYVDKYFAFWQRLMPADVVRRMTSPLGVDGLVDQQREVFRGVFAAHADTLDRPEDYINHSLYFEAKTFLHGLLVVDDKLSMGHGLETRVPFLDNDLVDFAQRLPAATKLGNLGEVVRLNENDPGPKTAKYFERTRDGKLILREVLGRYVPDDVAHGVKQGFSGPDASWFRGESIGYVRRLLVDGDARVHDVLDRTTIVGLVEEHVAGRANHRLAIWSLLCLEHWLRVFVDGEVPTR